MNPKNPVSPKGRIVCESWQLSVRSHLRISETDEWFVNPDNFPLGPISENLETGVVLCESWELSVRFHLRISETGVVLCESWELSVRFHPEYRKLVQCFVNHGNFPLGSIPNIGNWCSAL